MFDRALNTPSTSKGSTFLFIITFYYGQSLFGQFCWDLEINTLQNSVKLQEVGLEYRLDITTDRFDFVLYFLYEKVWKDWSLYVVLLVGVYKTSHSGVSN